MIFNVSWKSWIFLLSSLGLSITTMILTITQMNNIQIIGLEVFYGYLDKNFLFIRSSLFFLLSILGTVSFFRNPDFIISNRYSWRNINLIFFLLVIGLSAFYVFSCCDSPVVFYMGLPFSWLRGIAPASNNLPTTPFRYLLINVTRISWYVDIFSFIASSLFWNNVLIIWSFFTKRILLRATNHNYQVAKKD